MCCGKEWLGYGGGGKLVGRNVKVCGNPLGNGIDYGIAFEVCVASDPSERNVKGSVFEKDPYGEVPGAEGV